MTTHLQRYGQQLLLEHLAEFEGAGGDYTLVVDSDDPLIAFLLDFDDRRGLREHVHDFAVAQALDEVLEVLSGYVLVLADYLHHVGGGLCDYLRLLNPSKARTAKERRTARRCAPAFIRTSGDDDSGGGGFR